MARDTYSSRCFSPSICASRWLLRRLLQTKKAAQLIKAMIAATAAATREAFTGGGWYSSTGDTGSTDGIDGGEAEPSTVGHDGDGGTVGGARGGWDGGHGDVGGRGGAQDAPLDLDCRARCREPHRRTASLASGEGAVI